MKKRGVLFALLCCCWTLPVQARLFVSGVGARYTLDYEGVRTGPATVGNVTGNIELIGVAGGWAQLAPGFGYEAAFGVLGTNSQKLNPNPDWGIPWYYRTTFKGAYMAPFGLYGFAGADLMGSFYQDGENHYFGLGLMIGAGYRIDDRLSVSISNPNSSVLFADENRRVLRGIVIEGAYAF